MTGTTLPRSDAKPRLSELGRRVHEQRERVTVTRHGEAQFVLLSVDDLEGLEITLEVLGDEAAVERIADSPPKPRVRGPRLDRRRAAS